MQQIKISDSHAYYGDLHVLPTIILIMFFQLMKLFCLLAV